MPDEQKPHSFWTSIPGILTGTAALLTAVVGLMLAIKPNPPPEPPESSNTIFTTPMESSSLTCREICQARGADCVSARVSSQESGVAGCTFTSAGGSLRSKECVCRKV